MKVLRRITMTGSSITSPVTGMMLQRRLCASRWEIRNCKNWLAEREETLQEEANWGRFPGKAAPHRLNCKLDFTVLQYQGPLYQLWPSPLASYLCLLTCTSVVLCHLPVCLCRWPLLDLSCASNLNLPSCTTDLCPHSPLPALPSCHQPLSDHEIYSPASPVCCQPLSYCVPISLVPRPLRGGEKKAWCTLFAHAC